jgi:hypothetical protein
MRAFIVRPFGTKNGIDFDRIERELVRPALERVKIAGVTTADILEAGNIRIDMFEMLLNSDVVIADISIHNANVFYELGIRHALRSRQTILIRGRRRAGATDAPADVPFDIRTDRYFEYDPDSPGTAISLLISVLNDSHASLRKDSPVFLSLPDLAEQDRSKLMPVPRDFREEVDRASGERQIGKLGLLAGETVGLPWEMEGLRVVGRSQFKVSAYRAARDTWTKILAEYPDDCEANQLLGTILQRLGDLIGSDQALSRIVESPGLPPAERAEVSALMGRNDKARFQLAWADAPEKECGPRALRTPFLFSAFERYQQAFEQDLNHYYSGLNALSMVTITLDLMQAFPEVWAERFDTEEEAGLEGKRLGKQREQLSNAVAMALQGAKSRMPPNTTDVWLEISRADHRFLTAEQDKQAVFAYRQALAGVAPFYAESARRQLEIFASLGIRRERARACLEAFPTAPIRAEAAGPDPIRRVILFTGHMIDAPGRADPRFPASCESRARTAIRDAVKQAAANAQGRVLGIAGAASGGDILFHEVCGELGIPSRVRLALAPEPFVAASVAPAGPAWVERFSGLRTRLGGTLQMLQADERLPRWLYTRRDYDVWQRANLWMLQEALAMEAPELMLLALWDCQTGDGPGGTGHLVELARDRGAEIVILDTKGLFGGGC